MNQMCFVQKKKSHWSRPHSFYMLTSLTVSAEGRHFFRLREKVLQIHCTEPWSGVHAASARGEEFLQSCSLQIHLINTSENSSSTKRRTASSVRTPGRLPGIQVYGIPALRTQTCPEGYPVGLWDWHQSSAVLYFYVWKWVGGKRCFAAIVIPQW